MRLEIDFCVSVRHSGDMGRPKQDAPSHFGDLIAQAIKNAMKQYGFSGRYVAEKLGRSEGYVRERLNGTYEFALADIETFALFLGHNPEEFIGAIDRAALEAQIPDRPRAPLQTKTLREILAGDDSDDLAVKRRAKATAVGGSGEGLQQVANDSIDEKPTDDHDFHA